MSIEQLRKDNPQFASFSDDALIGMVSSQTGKSLQEVTSILVPGGDAAPQKLTPLQQVRKDNPSYAQYSDDALVGLISNQTGKSIQELRPILFQEPVEDDNREENPEALDYLKGFASGANKLVSGAGYLAELAGAKETGKSIREFGDRGAAYWNNRMTEGGKNAASTPVFEDDPESITGIKLTDDWGKALLMGASQSLPTMFAAAIPGVAVTKGIQALAKLGLAGGSGATIPLLAGTAAPVGIGSQAIARAPAAVGFGAAEGVTAGAINAAEFKSSIEEMSFDELSKSPVFQALKEQYGNEKAREMIAEQASQELFGKTVLSTGAISVLTGGGALGQAYQKISGASKGGLFSQTIKGAGQEALQEAPQSAGEKLIENITTRDYLDPSQDIKEGVLADAASGAAIGGFTGGLFGAGSAINVTNRASKINEERTKLGLQKISESETVDEAIQSATETVSQKPVTPEDIWDSTDMRDELLERAKSINQQQDGVINEKQTQGTKAPAAAEILNDPGLTTNSIVIPNDADIPASAFDGGKGRKQKETASNQSVIDSIANANTEVPTQRDSVLNSDIIAQNLSNSPRGNKSEIVLPNNTTLPAEWMVVDADSINATLKNGKNQPRDRSRISSDIQIQQIANNPDYRRLAESPVMDVGSPTISYDGAIVGGNGRFEGISRGYDAGTSVAYRAELESDAINKGIDPATFVGMKKPVLVRRITQPFDIKKLAVASNSGTSLEYSALERAKIDSERIGDIDKIEVNDSGDIALTQDNISNIRDSLKDYNTTEFGSFIDNEGNISQEGAHRLKNAILYSAYGDSKTLSRMIESTDSDMRNIIGALTRVGGQVSKVRSDIKAGVLPKELDITDNLIDAVEKIGQLRANGISVQKYMSQQSMFPEIETSQESKEIVQVLSELMRSQKRMTDFMRSMYDSISKIDITTNNIFGEQDAPKKLEVIKHAKRQQETTTKPTGSLFEETGSKSGAKKDSTGSGKESAKYSRSAGERLKDRERTKKLEKTLKKQGFNFTITPKDVRDFAAMDRGKENEAVTAERIARIFKKRITWIEAKGDFHINGVTLPSIQDTIFIDVTTDKYAHAVVGHELSHHMENDVPKVYQDLVNALSDIIPNTDEYAKKYGIKGADDAYIIKEIVGDIVGDNFTDPKFWDKVAAHNPNAFRRISDSIITWLKRLVTNARLRGLGSEKWVTDAQKAQDIVAKAVAQYTTLSSNPSKEDDQKPTVTIKKKRTIEPKFSFAGEKSGTADRYQLSNAKEKLANGVDKETVRKETGWFKGVDGKWRYEINDIHAELDEKNINEISEGGRRDFDSVPLLNVLKHDRLYAAYNELTNVKVRIDRSKKGKSASYNSNRNLITLSPDIKIEYGRNGMLSILLHEIQHVIQHKEGFATGGNVESSDGLDIKKALQDIRNQKAKLNIDPYKIKNQISAGFFVSESDKELLNEWERLKNIEDDILDSRLSPFDVYKRLAGEVEARNVQARQDMTAMERERYSPEYSADTPKEEVIIVFNGKVMDNAPPPDNYDYRMDHKAPSRDGGAPLHDLTGNGEVYPDDVYSSKAVQYYGTGDKYDKAVFEKVKLLKGKPDTVIEIYRAVPKDTSNEINPGDWVTINKNYAKEHGSSYLENFKIISKKVKASEVFTNGDSIHEWGYDPETIGPKFSSDSKENNDMASNSTDHLSRKFGYPKSANEPLYEFNSVERLKLHKEYTKAKSGNIVSAVKLARDLVSESNLAEAKKRFGNDVAYIPVILKESVGTNRIPHAIAGLYANYSNAEIETRVFEQKKAFHTGMNMMERLISRASFSGEIIKGKRYVLVDDVTTSGATLSDLASYIQENGGEVAGSVLLTNAIRGGSMYPATKTINRLEVQYGDSIREIFGIEPSALTKAESQYLLGFRSDDEIRKRANKARDSRSKRLFAKRIQKSEDSLKFSRAETLSQAGVDTKPKEETGKLPEETKMQAFRRRTQDAMLRFKVVQKWLDEQGVKLSEAANVYQRENISKGKQANKIEDFRRDQLEPLIKRIAESSKAADNDGKFTLGDVATYLEAIHIPEANERMRTIHKDENATANGITDEQARKVVKQFESMPNFGEFKKLSEEVRKIGTETLDMRLEAGVISQEKYDAFKSTFDAYVPLRGNMSKQGFGKGLSVNAKDKRRMGHGFREDEFVLENLVQDRERAIMQIEKNKVFLSVAQFLMEAKNENIGTVDKPEKMRVMKDFSYAVKFKGDVVGSFETESAAKAMVQRVIDKKEKILDGKSFTSTDFSVEKTYDPHITMMARPMLADNEIQGYVNGHTVKLQLNDPGIARAATNAGIEQVGSIAHAARMFNRFLSKAYTAWSPDFLFMNMARDAYSGTMVLTGKKGSAFFAKVLANYGTSVKELIKGRNDPKKSKWIKRYRNAGGNIGAAYLSDIERIGEDAVAALQEFAGARETYRMEYNNQISRGSSEKKARTMAALKASVAKTKAMPVVGHMFKTLENMNMIIENALRLATFKTAIEQGESDQQAAMLSRDLMNFNRKGEMANKMGAAYLFYNPGMQGIHIVGEALFTSKHRKQVWALLGALTSISFMLSELARGGGDDEDEREWENIPDYIKDRNLILKVGDHQITIPVAYGFGIFHAMGNYLSDLNHGADINEVSVKLASGMFENFSVFGNPILDDGEDIRLDQLLPTLPKIIMAPGINMDGLGRQIHPEKAVWNESIPDSQNMFRSVRGTAYEDITNFMNEVTGGSKYNPGAIDISPNTVKYWVTSLTGGAGRFVSDVVTGSVGAAQGVTPELENIPVARKFIRQSGVSDSRSAFHNARKEVEAATQRFRKAVKDGDVFNSQKILGENKEIIALSDFTSDSRKLSAAKRDSILNIQQDKSLSKAEKKVKIREIELQEQRIYDRFLRIFDQKKAKQSDQ